MSHLPLHSLVVIAALALLIGFIFAVFWICGFRSGRVAGPFVGKIEDGFRAANGIAEDELLLGADQGVSPASAIPAVIASAL